MMGVSVHPGLGEIMNSAKGDFDEEGLVFRIWSVVQTPLELPRRRRFAAFVTQTEI